MLVGALAYTFAIEIELFFLIPALAGALIAIGGLACLHDDVNKRGMMITNLLGGYLILIYVAFRLIPDIAALKKSHIGLVSDLFVFVLTVLLIITSKKELKSLKPIPPKQRLVR